ncbi:MAG: SAM-dependent chlorinase/fluorinase [Ignavibacteriales bacterium]|nr:SAM-dependent chlorinase/fluorinase [Ignavibacteriales bacterium]
MQFTNPRKEAKPSPFNSTRAKHYKVVKKKTSVRFPRSSPFPVVALLTDFGLEDHYVGTMKAVILSIHPRAHIVDITHEVAAHQVQQAGYLLWSAYNFFPRGTLFVTVVDPGVGSQRRILAVRSQHYTFLAPDNGLLDFVLIQTPAKEIVQIDLLKAKRFLPSNVSSTFHGRDILAPIAAYLSSGKKLQSFGKRIKLPGIREPFVNGKKSAVKPCILHIDHFGNIVTNILVAGLSTQDIQTMAVGKALVSRWIHHYDEAPDRTPCFITGSSGLVEIVVKKDNAARLLSASVNSPLTIYWT